MNERMRFNPAEASAAGTEDASALLVAISHMEEGESPANLLSDAMGDIIGLAVENRLDECEARKAAFCTAVGPVLHNAVSAADQLEALRAKCALLSASLRQAEAMQESAITDSEGGEL